MFYYNVAVCCGGDKGINVGIKLLDDGLSGPTLANHHTGKGRRCDVVDGFGSSGGAKCVTIPADHVSILL